MTTGQKIAIGIEVALVLLGLVILIWGIINRPRKPWWEK